MSDDNWDFFEDESESEEVKVEKPVKVETKVIEEPVKKKKKITPKKECQYCSKKYSINTIDNHEKKCSENPINKVKEHKVIEEPEIDFQIDFNINEFFEKLSTSSDFHRVIYRALTGKYHRGKDIDLKRELSILLKKTNKAKNKKDKIR
ncbi:MAG: hypothetical protein ACFFG0_07475 [Candidatus Thorarchaeota archaeon]